MPIMAPAPVDAEIAAATFKEHIEELWGSGRPAQRGWELEWVDPLHVLVKMPARRASGEVDSYYILLGAEYYDSAPPTVAIVDPQNRAHAPHKSKWFPHISPPSWFGLHHAYTFPGSVVRQLVCFTFSAEYYMTDHSPKDSEKWQQGRHTVAATLNRLQEVLSPPHYQGPSS